MRRKDVEDCEYLTIYLFINKLHCGLKICGIIGDVDKFGFRKQTFRLVSIKCNYISLRSAKRGETYIQQCSELSEKEIQVRPALNCKLALRGYNKTSSTPAKIETLDMDLRIIATSC